MTTLWIASDQHYEIYGTPRDFPIPEPEADIFVCAGDLMREPAEGIRWLDAMLTIPSVYVAGNHEYYRGSYTAWRDQAAAENELRPKVSYLENAVDEVGGIRFIGCTLWTDYALFGEDTIESSKWFAEKRMNDFRLIRYSAGGSGRSWRDTPLQPNHLANLHAGSVAFLDRALSEKVSCKTVVVTHHAPHPRSIDEKYKGDTLNPAFASDLTWLIEKYQPDLWIHGHVHSSFDYMVGKTRIIANPQGYDGENPDFDPALIVEIRRRRR
ncbi:metallophosphoesterase [Rhizobium sp. P007]|uniref:metallophosphoesterase n=1 Tax=Rhizobium sp. P007 TaxID=285908 RepID=UPI00115A1556|nr:metallophosphoesterase [Rhizobium sp. P007]CAD7058614.1 phosphatase [Rhizobium sp. P007]